MDLITPLCHSICLDFASMSTQWVFSQNIWHSLMIVEFVLGLLKNEVVTTDDSGPARTQCGRSLPSCQDTCSASVSRQESLYLPLVYLEGFNGRRSPRRRVQSLHSQLTDEELFSCANTHKIWTSFWWVGKWFTLSLHSKILSKEDL